MRKSYFIVSLLLFLTSLSAQQIKLSGQDPTNPALSNQLNNYFGCKVWSNDSCLECSQRFYFNSKGVCTEVQETCRQFNTKQGICQKCYEGYSVVNGKCETVNTAIPEKIGCASWKGGLCTLCAKRWYFNSKKICVKINDSCSTWDETSGACKSCYFGYIISNGVCVLNVNLTTIAGSNPLCKAWIGSRCTQCSSRAYFNQKGICTSVSDNCNSFDKATGDCLTCFGGYNLLKKRCALIPIVSAGPSDAGCQTWDWQNQKCLVCSQRWAFNKQNVCAPIADECATNGKSSVCTSCYKGYDLLKDGKCVYSLSNDIKPFDLGCRTWDWQNQICLQCSTGWFFNSTKVCVPISALCKTTNQNATCTSCFKGYDLKDGKCILSDFNNAKPADPGCRTWDWDNQICLNCSFRWIFNDKKACVPVSDLCRTFSQDGNCTSCYQGYNFRVGKCVLSNNNSTQPGDPGCRVWDFNLQICLKCSQGWYFNEKNICVTVSDQCKTYTQNGNCTSCYQGYDLKDGKCIFSPSNTAPPPDLNCASWDWKNLTCLKCANRFFFNSLNKCVPVDNNCFQYSQKGICTSCYLGFIPNNNGSCVQVNLQCKTLNTDGTCASCYPQNIVYNGNCVPVAKLANVLLYYSQCCPQKLQGINTPKIN